MNTLSLVEAICNGIEANAKVKESVVRNCESDITEFLSTIGHIEAQGKYGTTILASDGNRYTIGDYKLDKRLSPLVTTRSVTLTSDENSPELMANTIFRRRDTFDKDSEAFDSKGKLDEAKAISGTKVQALLQDMGKIINNEEIHTEEFIEFGAKNGNVYNVFLTNDDAVQTPAKFLEAQSKLFSLFKSSVGSCATMEELTKPLLLSDVLDRVDNGYNTLSTVVDVMSLPVTLKCYAFIYKDYMYNYSLDEFAKQFTSHFIVNSLCVKPAID